MTLTVKARTLTCARATIFACTTASLIQALDGGSRGAPAGLRYCPFGNENEQRQHDGRDCKLRG